MSSLFTKPSLWGLALVVSTYLPSLFFSTLIPAEGNPTFLIGLVCLLFGFGELPWLANPLLALSGLLVLLRRPRWALPVAVAALGVATTAFGIESVPFNESGSEAAVVGYGVGFVLWMVSLVGMLVATIVGSLEAREPGVGFAEPSRSPVKSLT